MTSSSPTPETAAEHDDTLDRARELTLVPVFAGIVAAMAVVPTLNVVPGVPITLQSVGVILAGALLGARRGGLALLLWLVLLAVGLPVRANGAGLGVFFSASGGFLIGFPVAAYVVGWLTERFGTPYRLGLGLVANAVGGIVVLYAFGVWPYMYYLGTSFTDTLIAFAGFLPGDIAKVVIAALIARGVHAAYPGLIPARRSAEKGTGDPARG